MCPMRRARGPFLRIQNCRSAGTREGFAMAKILIVDDEPRIRELIEEHLEHGATSVPRRQTAPPRWPRWLRVA